MNQNETLSASSQVNTKNDDLNLEIFDEDPLTLNSSTATGTTPSFGTENKSSTDEIPSKKKLKTNYSEVWNYCKRLWAIDGMEKRICKFDEKAYRDGLAKAIIKHDLPFDFAEYEGFNEINKVLNPEFRPVCRKIAISDVKAVYSVEKEKLKSVLAKIPGRICLTSDEWTAVATKGYMTVSAHYVDEKWELNSKLLAFCDLESPHTSEELAGQLLRVVEDWGISSKIFSITIDNATSNNVMQRVVRDRFNIENALLCKGEFFHVRSCAHILDLAVQGGLNEAAKSVEKIRESVKYVKASEGRLKLFRKCIEERILVGVGGGFLRLDVLTRWDSTYLMLESAIKY